MTIKPRRKCSMPNQYYCRTSNLILGISWMSGLPAPNVGSPWLSRKSPNAATQLNLSLATWKLMDVWDGNFLKGAVGDAINALLCGAGHNLRKILRQLALLCAPIELPIISVLLIPPRLSLYQQLCNQVFQGRLDKLHRADGIEILSWECRRYDSHSQAFLHVSSECDAITTRGGSVESMAFG